jgi:hypothetical protein|tara:strand:+ start:1540 stop:1740 length:201 start_codon:yes stop_codon:yes gene_type:complete
MKISDIIINETASVGGMSAGAVATVVKPIANDAQRIAQRPKKPKKTKWAHKKPGPKTKKESTLIKR